MSLFRIVLACGLVLSAGFGFVPSTFPSSNAEGALSGIPNVSMKLLKHFIVVPEHKLLFCYMEKVACTNFNELFRFLRQRYEPSQGEGGPWQRNNPWQRGVGEMNLKDLLTNKSWHKAVFYREPLERFVSGYKSKCGGADGKEGHSHCKHMFGNESIHFEEAVAHLRELDTDNGGDITAERKLDLHFRLQTDFCGGLASTLQYYDTVEELDRNTAHAKVAKLLRDVGVEAETVPHFHNLFPPPGDDSWERKRHNTNSVDDMSHYLPDDKPDLALALIRHYRRDYETFAIPVPEWAPKSDLLAGLDGRKGQGGAFKQSGAHDVGVARARSPFLSRTGGYHAADARSHDRAMWAPHWPL